VLRPKAVKGSRKSFLPRPLRERAISSTAYGTHDSGFTAERAIASLALSADAIFCSDAPIRSQPVISVPAGSWDVKLFKPTLRMFGPFRKPGEDPAGRPFCFAQPIGGDRNKPTTCSDENSIIATVPLRLRLSVPAHDFSWGRRCILS